MTLGVPKISGPLSLAVVWMYSLAGLEINSYSILTGELVSPRQILCKGKEKCFTTGTASEEERTAEIL